MAPVIPDDATAFFIHVMKTGGTSFVQNARQHVTDDRCLPQVGAESTPGEGRYGKTDWLSDLTDEDRSRIRFAAGHWPYAVRDLIGADLTLTVLRHPVDRTISFLRHARRHHKKFRGHPMREIYEDWHQYGFFIYQYQLRQFAKREGDDLDHIAVILMDQERLETAKENLAQVDVLGIHDRYDEWEVAAHQVMGWPHQPLAKLRVSYHRDDIDDDLRAQIESDNAMDIEFYEWAVQLYEERGGPLAPHLDLPVDS